MRILLTADPELPVPPVLYGGIERVIDLLARELVRRGHDVTLLAHPDSRSAASALRTWPAASSRGAWNAARNTLALTAAVRDIAPDLVHSFSRLLYMTAILRSRRPLVMSYQRPPTSRTVQQAARWARNLSFTGCSEALCQEGRAAGGDWTAIHNAVDVTRFTFQPHVAADAPLLFLSRVEPVKGAHRAIAIAKKAGRRLVIAGNHGEHGEEGRYWREAILPQLGRDVEYVGPVNDAQKDEWLGCSAALLVPIEWDEPFGIVFAEALACGTPVLSCPRGALPEIVRSGREGFLAAEDDGLAAAVALLGTLDRAACRRRAEEAFSVPVIVDQYEALYRRRLG